MDNNHFMTQEDIDKVVNIFMNCNQMEDGETRWYPLAEDVEDNLWAIVLGKGYNEDYPEDIMAKIAFCPKHSGMYEYGYDWEMPYDELSGEIWDTETAVGVYDPHEFSVARQVRWYAGQWKQMVDSGTVNFEDEEDDEEEDE